GVAEDEEVVADELELEDGLLGIHRRAERELLRLDDLRLVTFGHGRHGVRGPPVCPRGSPAAGPPPGALTRALPPQPVDALVRGRRSRAEDRAVRPDRRLGDVVLRDRRVPLDGQLELDARVRELPLELRELRLGIAPDRVADLEVPALDLELHRPSFDASLLARN